MICIKTDNDNDNTTNPSVALKLAMTISKVELLSGCLSRLKTLIKVCKWNIGTSYMEGKAPGIPEIRGLGLGLVFWECPPPIDFTHYKA